MITIFTIIALVSGIMLVHYILKRRSARQEIYNTKSIMLNNTWLEYQKDSNLSARQYMLKRNLDPSEYDFKTKEEVYEWERAFIENS